MRMKFRKLTVFFVLILIFVSGCKNTDNVSNLVTIRQKKIDIYIWKQKNNASDYMLDNTVKKFMQKYPNVNIDIKEVSKTDIYSLASKKNIKKPDIVFADSSNIGVLADNRIIKPINDFMPATFWNKIYKKATAAVQYKNQSWMVPSRFLNNTCMIYNPKLIDKQPISTFNQIQTAMKKPSPKLKGKIVFAYQLDRESFMSFFNVFNMKVVNGKTVEGQLFDAKGNVKIDTKAMTDTLRYILGLKVMGNISSFTNEQMGSMLKEGTLAMAIGDYNQIVQDKKQKFDYWALPTIDPAKTALRPYYRVEGFALGENKFDKDKKDVLANFLEFNLNPDVQDVFVTNNGYLSVLDSNVKQAYSDPLKRAVIEQLEELSIPAPNDKRMDAILAIIEKHLVIIEKNYLLYFNNKEKLQQAAINIQKEASLIK
jgi:ABC-type glycerol-3-phosphate transport system substrate-binding protein